MSLHDRRYAVYFGASVLMGLISTLGADVLARVMVQGADVATSVSEHARYAVIEPLSSAFLYTPFLLLGWMSASLARRKGFGRALAVFVPGMLLLAALYFHGYHASQMYMTQRAWTAATLSVAFLPIKSVPLLLLCLGVRWFVGRGKANGKPATSA
jgi:hypothetical protein